jgi:GTPase SAR1 family protein
VAADFPWDQLGHVKGIDFRKCPLKSIPIGISKLNPKVFKSLQLDSQSLVGYHKALIEYGTSVEEIISILKESLVGGVTLFKEIKVMVVGEPAVGKTTMLNVLKGKTPQELLAHPCVATDGIDLEEKVINGYLLTFWDFAGQEVYRYTHQLFLSDNSLCLITYRLTTNEEESRRQLFYWMDSVLQRAPNATCLLVGTCAHNFPDDVAKQKLITQLKELRGHFGDRIGTAVAIDSLHGSGFSALKTEITKLAAKKVIPLSLSLSLFLFWLVFFFISYISLSLSLSVSLLFLFHSISLFLTPFLRC